jgi:hypothetical protein
MLSNSVVEHHMKDLAKPVCGFRRDPIPSDPCIDKRAHHVCGQLLQRFDLDMTAGKAVLDDGALGLAKAGVPCATEFQGIADRPKEDPQIGDVILVGFPRPGGCEMPSGL